MTCSSGKELILDTQLRKKSSFLFELLNVAVSIFADEKV
jgi:hypothetical protein